MTQSSRKDKVRHQAEQGLRASWRNSGKESSEGTDGRPPWRGLAWAHTTGVLRKQGSPVLWRFSSAGRHQLVAVSRRLSRTDCTLPLPGPSAAGPVPSGTTLLKPPNTPSGRNPARSPPQSLGTCWHSVSKTMFRFLPKLLSSANELSSNLCLTVSASRNPLLRF